MRFLYLFDRFVLDAMEGEPAGGKGPWECRTIWTRELGFGFDRLPIRIAMIYTMINTVKATPPNGNIARARDGQTIQAEGVFPRTAVDS